MAMAGTALFLGGDIIRDPIAAAAAVGRTRSAGQAANG
jgi:hypothetical protein